MSRDFDEHNAWAAGELSPRLIARHDVEQIQFSAQRLRNVLVTPQGGLQPAPGIEMFDEIEDEAAIFELTTGIELSYTIVVDDAAVTIFRNGAVEETIATSLWNGVTATLRATELNARVYLTCPTVPTQVLTRVAVDTWTLTALGWSVDGTRGGRSEEPRCKFEPEACTIQASGATGTVTLTTREAAGGAARAVWYAGHVGSWVYIQDKACKITAVAGDHLTATATTYETLPTAETTDWTESATGAYRGYLKLVAFYQDRMHAVPSSAPNTACVSGLSDYTNFATAKADGTVLATHGMVLRLIRDQRYAEIHDMRASADELFVLTAAGLASFRPAGQSAGYSPTNREVDWKDALGGTGQMVLAGGAVLYVAYDGRSIIEHAQRQGGASSVNVTLLSEHLFLNGIADLVRIETPYAALVALTSEGKLVVITYSPGEGVFAPTVVDPAPGTIEAVVLSASAEGDRPVCKMKYGAKYYLARMKPVRRVAGSWSQLMLSLSGTSVTPKTTWDGLDMFPDDTELTVVADDNVVHTNVVVTAGEITLPVAASTIEAGYMPEVVVRTRALRGRNPVMWELRRPVSAIVLMRDVDIRQMYVQCAGGSKFAWDLRRLERGDNDELLVDQPVDGMPMMLPWLELTVLEPLYWELLQLGVLLELGPR